MTHPSLTQALNKIREEAFTAQLKDGQPNYYGIDTNCYPETVVDRLSGALIVAMDTLEFYSTLTDLRPEDRVRAPLAIIEILAIVGKK